MAGRLSLLVRVGRATLILVASVGRTRLTFLVEVGRARLALPLRVWRAWLALLLRVLALLAGVGRETSSHVGGCRVRWYGAEGCGRV